MNQIIQMPIKITNTSVYQYPREKGILKLIFNFNRNLNNTIVLDSIVVNCGIMNVTVAR